MESILVCRENKAMAWKTNKDRSFITAAMTSSGSKAVTKMTKLFFELVEVKTEKMARNKKGGDSLYRGKRRVAPIHINNGMTSMKHAAQPKILR